VLGITEISTGEILRAAIAAGTDLGKQVQTQVEQGELVADESMIQFIRTRLLQPDVAQGWLLEGYPRTAFQAEELDFLLEELHQHFDQAIWLDVSEAVLTHRSLARARVDDTPERIHRRIEHFFDRTTPLIEYYQLRDRLLWINGDQSIEQVEQEILEKLGGGS
jgi:adenylate kinase